MRRLHSTALTLLGLGALSVLLAAGCEPAPYAELQTSSTRSPKTETIGRHSGTGG
jgi:hypothetical protein